MLDSTYADKAFSENISRIAYNSEKSVAALEAIANHLGVIVGMMKRDRHLGNDIGEGFTEPRTTPVDTFAQPVI